MSENLYETNHESGDEAVETLRLLAALPPPAELTERVHRRLAEAQAVPERRGFWSLWMPVQRFQFAAAAVLAVVVAGSMWSVYHGHPQTGSGGRTASPAGSGTQAGSPDAGGGFDGAKAARVPPTLNPIKVPPAPKKKPGAGHAAKPSPKTLAVQSSGTQADVKSTTNP
jgi:hypothetical protein